MSSSTKTDNKETVAKDNDEDMPEHIRKTKEKWEKENPGKTYRYKKGKKDMPGIKELLAYGDGKTTTTELILYPTILVLLFVASFAIFLWVDPVNNSKYPKGRFSLSKIKNRVNPDMKRPDPTGATPERILEKKEKIEGEKKPDHEEL